MLLQESGRSHLVMLGGRSGVGKTTIAAEMHLRLSEAGVQHAVIEGDSLDLAWPAPWEHSLAERNLSAIWQNYRDLGYRKLVFTNTVSVMQQEVLAEAMGDDPIVTAFLLECNDESTRERLSAREIGSGLQAHLERSSARASDLTSNAPANVVRVTTDQRSVTDIAGELLAIVGWGSREKENGND